jgi:Flp pilus assembly protein TadD
MNPVYWAWAAVTGDLVLFMGSWISSVAISTFWAVLGAHVAISGVAAMATYLLLPSRFRQPRTTVTALMFSFAFVAPVMGALGLLILTRANLSKSLDDARVAVPVSLDLPIYDVQAAEHQRGGQGAARSRLGQEVPSALRMQSLLTLQAVPNRVANPILEELLGDATEDVRLVAFGMLDSEEKKIAKEIRFESERQLHDLTKEQRYNSLQRLAELNWELVYACLIQGELRLHILQQARSHLDAALAMGVPPGSGLIFLQGKIFLELGEFEAAELAILQAMRLGQAKTSTLPYLAEIAFHRRDFSQVRQFMLQLSTLNLASRTRAVEDFWNMRDSEINYFDRRYLPHI